MANETETSLGLSGDVGSRLRTAREAKKISLRDIANTTKISVGALEALEQNDVTELPGGIFTRAFLRSYASEVGLDPEETVRDFMSSVASDRRSDETRHDSDIAHAQDIFRSQRRMAATVLWVAAVAIPLAGVLFYWAVWNGKTVAEDGVATVVAPESRVPEIDPPGSEMSVARVSDVVEESLAIVLRPKGECWVSLTIDGEEMFARVMRAGEQESYQAQREIILNVGDAGTFDFSVNDQPGRSLGGAGEVVSETITIGNYRGYLAR
jgi:cytoskeletal protein RodZ